MLENGGNKESRGTEGQSNSMAVSKALYQLPVSSSCQQFSLIQTSVSFSPAKALSPYCSCHWFKLWGSYDSAATVTFGCPTLLSHCHIASLSPPTLKDSKHNKTSCGCAVCILPFASEGPLFFPLLTIWVSAFTTGSSRVSSCPLTQPMGPSKKACVYQHSTFSLKLTGSEILLYTSSQYSHYHFMDVGKKDKILGSETKYFITHTQPGVWT